MKQLVNVGAAPNDGTGDLLRNAFIKINDNADELYQTGQDWNPYTGFTGIATATWTGTGLTFDVRWPVYYIQGVRYPAGSTQVTLDAADPANPRLDTIAIDATGAIKITGVPSVNPVRAMVDVLTQIAITTARVNAATTVPAGVINEDVYLENTEWTGSSDNGTVNFAATTNPLSGTKHVDVGAFTNGQFIKFVDTPKEFADYDVIRFYVNLKAAFGASAGFVVKLYSGATEVSSGVTVTDGRYGFDQSVVGTYQLISIPVKDLVINNGQFDTLYIELKGSNATGFQLDDIVIQSGLVGVSKEKNDLASIITSNGAAVVNQPSDAFKFVGGTGLSISASGKTITFDLTGGTGHTIQNDGSPLTNRSSLNFNNGLVAIDDSGNDASVVGIGTNAVLNTHIRQSVARSVIGNATASLADVADITASADEQVLRRTSGTLSFGSLTVGMAPNNLWSYGKIQQVTASSLLGNASGALANVAEISLGYGLQFTGSALELDSGAVVSIAGSYPNPSWITSLAFTKITDVTGQDTFVVSSEANMLALSAKKGDIAVRTDTSDSYRLLGTDPAILANWQLLLSSGLTIALGDNYAWTGTHSFLDANFSILDSAVQTKVAKFEAGSISAATTRTFTFPDADGVFVLESLAATLTNKTLGSGTVWSVAPSITDGLRITFNPDATNAGLNVGSHTADPSSPINGDVYYDSTNNLLRAYINSFWISLGAGGGSGHTIQDSGTPLTARTNLNFTDGLDAIDDVGNNASVVGIADLGVTTAKLAAGAVTDAKVTDVAWGKITSTPTTLAGYGITDAYTQAQANAAFWKVAGTTTLTGDVTIDGGFRTTFTPDATIAGVNVGNVVSDPSTPVQGDIWILTNNGNLKVQQAITREVVVTGSYAANRIPYYNSSVVASLSAEAGFEYIAGTNTLSVDNTKIAVSALVGSTGTITAATTLDVRGISGGNALRIADDSDSPKVVLLNSGYFGIGPNIDTPVGSFEWYTESAITSDRFFTLGSHVSNLNHAVVNIKTSRGSRSSPTVVDNGDRLGQFIWEVRNTTTYALYATLALMSNGAISESTVPVEFAFAINNNGGVNVNSDRKFTIRGDGNLGVNTTDIEAWSSGNAIEMPGVAWFYGLSGSAAFSNLATNAYHDGNWRYKATGSANTLRIGDNFGFLMRVAQSGTADGVITWTDAFQINSDGEVSVRTAPVTNTSLAVNGISGGNIARFADDANTPILTVQNDGAVIFNTATPNTALITVKGSSSYSNIVRFERQAAASGWVISNTNGGLISYGSNIIGVDVGFQGGIDWITVGGMKSIDTNTLNLRFTNSGYKFKLDNTGVTANATRPYAFNITWNWADDTNVGNVAAIELSPTYNFTVAATGNAYGIYYNPTVTSVLGTHWAAYFGSGKIAIVEAPANDDTLTQVLVRDGSTGEIKYRTAGSLGGAPSWLLASGGTLTGANTIVGTATNILSYQFDSLGTTQTNGAGALFVNTTAAADGVQQISPSVVWEGQGWKTNATAASQSVRFATYVLPVQGAAAPTGDWRLLASINGGAYDEIIRITSRGNFRVTTDLFSNADASIELYTQATKVVRISADGAFGVGVRDSSGTKRGILSLTGDSSGLGISWHDDSMTLDVDTATGRRYDMVISHANNGIYLYKLLGQGASVSNDIANTQFGVGLLENTALSATLQVRGNFSGTLLLLEAAGGIDRFSVDSDGNILVNNTSSVPSTPTSSAYIYSESGVLKSKDTTGRVYNLQSLLTKGVTVESPTNAEDITMWFTDKAITVHQINAVVRGTTPSVTIQVRHSTDRSAAGNAILTSAQAITGQTTGSEFTSGSFSDATIPAGSWVWLETTAQSGTVDELNVTLSYTED
jgi:hypothetical protein